MIMHTTTKELHILQSENILQWDERMFPDLLCSPRHGWVPDYNRGKYGLEWTTRMIDLGHIATSTLQSTIEIESNVMN